jgi:hypothetical protein
LSASSGFGFALENIAVEGADVEDRVTLAGSGFGVVTKLVPVNVYS